MSNMSYDIELLNSVVSSGSMSYELLEIAQNYGCGGCSGCTGCQGER